MREPGLDFPGLRVHLPAKLMLASLDFFERLPAAGFAIVHPVKVVSLRDLHPAGSLRFPLVAPKPAASALRPPL